MRGVESLNLKAKLTARKFYCFWNPKIQKPALSHQLGRLPTQELTNKFCWWCAKISGACLAGESPAAEGLVRSTAYRVLQFKR